MSRVLRYEDGLLPNVLALSYAFVGYPGGIALILSDSWLLNFCGVLLLAHAMVIAAYLVHECAHNTIFAGNEHNARLGALLNWLTGACYGDYEAIRHKHFRHHVDRADVVAFDYRTRLKRRPFLLRLLKALEWAYVPAVEVMMHVLVLVLPFTMASRRRYRARVIAVLLVRVSLFAGLVWLSPRALILYPLAYLLFLTVMRFMDAHQHTYEIFKTLEHERGSEVERFDREYEHRNTFSNLFSVQRPWLNVLVLNFGYHNAHHVKPTAPWYRLPSLHQELFGDDHAQLLPISNLLRAYHRYRVPRILNADGIDVGMAQDRGRDFVGVDGVSFLTAH